MTALRQRKGDMNVAALEIPLKEAAHGKRCLQSALELVKRVRAQLLPGPLAEALDQTERQIVVGITVLRDADKTERSVAFVGRAEDARELTCPNCDKPVMTRAKQYTTCPHCGKTFRVTVQQRIPRKSKAGGRP